MVEIRKYRTEDRKDLERICSVTDPRHFPSLYLYTLYLKYYIEDESGLSLVSSVDGKTAGYILCAPDYGVWKRRMREVYLRNADDMTRRDGEDAIRFYSPYAGEYPAHLHIDIDPSFQRMGLGTALVDALSIMLKEKNIKGLMLGVERTNVKGVSFYEKYGFKKLDSEGSAYGLLLSQKEST